MNNNKAKWLIVPFIIIIMGTFIINIMYKDKAVSVSENRALEQKPILEDLKKGEYTNKFESYFSDQFPFREELSNVYVKAKLSFGSNKVRNYYLLDDNWIMPTPVKVISDEELKKLAKDINELAQIGIETNKEIYYVSIPHKESMLSHLYPKYTEGLDNVINNKNRLKKYIDIGKVKFLDVDDYFLKKFTEKEREKLYFKTDHHWNGIGAFEGFKYIIKEMNILDKKPWNEYTITMFDKGFFLGSYNKNLSKLVKEDEIIPYVHKKDKPNYKYFQFDGSKDVEGKEEDFVAQDRNKEEILYGGAYVFSDVCSILKIRNDEALINKKVIIFRDSYQAPTLWLFADIFAEVQLVDPRYVDKLDITTDDIIRKSDADIVIFMYNNKDFKEMIETMRKRR